MAFRVEKKKKKKQREKCFDAVQMSQESMTTSAHICIETKIEQKARQKENGSLLSSRVRNLHKIIIQH